MAQPRRPRLTDEENFRRRETEEEPFRSEGAEEEPLWRPEDEAATSFHYTVEPNGTVRPATPKERGMIDPNDLGLDEAVKLQLIPTDIDVKLRVINVQKKQDKREQTYYGITFEAVDYPDTEDFYWMLYERSPYMRKKDNIKRSQQWKDFMEAFDYTIHGDFNPVEDFMELEGWAILGSRINADWGPQNTLQRFVRAK